ncbi:hypothetical protein Sango_1893600 [Sesamum angolense]|uniref:Retrotransposon gag domain-containing protein n=1 Tax=Sesamum angolense TaxID=2727404 RepID=A0AAE1WJD1_9LAMI|nr:hypothetical protein Sango_1893600 [Sesamum angolense]
MSKSIEESKLKEPAAAAEVGLRVSGDGGRPTQPGRPPSPSPSRGPRFRAMPVAPDQIWVTASPSSLATPVVQTLEGEGGGMGWARATVALAVAHGSEGDAVAHRIWVTRRPRFRATLVARPDLGDGVALVWRSKGRGGGGGWGGAVGGSDGWGGCKRNMLEMVNILSQHGKIRAIMKRRFGPSYYHRELHNHLQCFTKDSKSVDEYYKEMEIATIQTNIIEDNEATMAHFLHGLNLDITDVVEMHHYVQLEEMVH